MNKLYHFCKMMVVFSIKFLAQLIGIVLGVVLVPIGLLFTDDSAKPYTYTTKDGSEWWLRRLPKWLLWWDNPIDGFLGDDQFRWANRDIPFGIKNTSFFGQVIWGAYRNPFNYFKRFVLSCDVRNHKVEKLAGVDYIRDDFNSTGWQWLRCGNNYTIYWVRRWGMSNRAIVVQLGNKIKLADNTTTYPPEQEYKYFKGFTFEVQPFKDIS